MSMDSHLNSVSSTIAFRIKQFNPLKSYANEITRKRYAVSNLLSVLEYGLPLYAGETPKIKLQVHRNLMVISRFIKGSYCFRQSTKSILDSIRFPDSDQLIAQNTVKYIHKIIHSRRPKGVYKLFRKQRSRKCTLIYPNYFSSTLLFDRNVYNKSIKMYNSLPAELRCLPPHKFNKKIKEIRIETK